jgi:hypothetical protein
MNWSSCQCSRNGETPVLAITICCPSDLTNWRRTCASVLMGEQCVVVGPEYWRANKGEKLPWTSDCRASGPS